MSDYIKQLENQNEELQQKLANAVIVEWRRQPLNKYRWDLYIGSTSRYIVATLMHTEKDIHVKGCRWQLSFTNGANSFHATMDDARQYTMQQLTQQLPK